MKREIIITADGSKTIHLPSLDEQYHSKHGAIQEARHVFIEAGLLYLLSVQNLPSIKILEIGFGTGLNSFKTQLEAQKRELQIDYTAVEAYPVALSEIKQLNYATLLNASETDFLILHTSEWERKNKITNSFSLTKRKQLFLEINDKNTFNLIYFDAFGARVQPELWTEVIFQKMYEALNLNGVLVTYSAKGSVRRAMQAVGFTVERLPGPPGKREMLRATKKLA